MDCPIITLRASDILFKKDANQLQQRSIQCEAPKIAKLVYNSNNYVFLLITTVTGAYKPTYNWGASDCSDLTTTLPSMVDAMWVFPVVNVFFLEPIYIIHQTVDNYCKSTNETLSKSDFEVRATTPRIVHFQLGNKYELFQLA